ncbi:MAG: homocysteine S-methyltransferase family protein, partial [Clostridia bacterium]|nr:homocysteine S-methyltransferase family protein [Clostridia bacterium]
MKITEYLKNNIVYLDGGMGTLLQAGGLKPGELPERLNLTNPELIQKIHRDYVNAGANVIITNTFGANVLKYSVEELEQIVKCAIENARKAIEGSENRFVALDIGPSGKMLAPYGDLDFEDAVNIFAQTIKFGVKYGADLIFIETMNDSYETKSALLAAKENSDLPVFVSNAYAQDGKLITGADACAMVAMLEGMGADAIGVNCSFGPKMLAPVVKDYLKYASVPVLLKPNAGLPKMENGKTVYDISPDEFANEVAELVKCGVKIVGGCCGTTPEYIAKTVQKTKDIVVEYPQKKDYTVVSSYAKSVIFGNKPVLIGERINPTGKKKFKEALRANDTDYILKEGISQKEKGAEILDVNVGLPEIDEVAMLENAVTSLQSVLDLPLQIDTSNYTAMEKALRRYNGKAMINSVSGKSESMDAVFPLAKKYGGVVVALTLDENGIPPTASGRVEIAKKILKYASYYGIDKKDIVFDPLALTISADKNSAVETLKAVKMIREELGCHTSLGVSNVSFGLPERDLINGTFFALALGNGLSCAIMNPYSSEMMKTYYTYNALNGLDDNCANYIEFSATVEKTVATVTTSNATVQTGVSELQKAIIKGLKEQAGKITSDLVKTVKPLDIVQNEIIPALDIVGVDFENKKVFLPQLLMSAESAKSAFEVIKSCISISGTA